eukprot:NODE_33120_length_312_cov_5.286486.p2 GENE.NODE_33120_length_312_cov_5.286486~~NODE_33120_length_312_cov_5.286486.p2  ORF type:complete len:91 (+),score=17.78 NODE_33120_length_312_cov_5.286486:37-309(+)
MVIMAVARHASAHCATCQADVPVACDSVTQRAPHAREAGSQLHSARRARSRGPLFKGERPQRADAARLTFAAAARVHLLSREGAASTPNA